MSSSNSLDGPEIKRLGVFDSGLGGLTVLKELLRRRPGHDYVYFGDTAHVPYGSRPADEVIHLVTVVSRYLVSQDCDGIILACNTTSALALSALRATFDVPVVGVIETASREAARVSDGSVAVLATPLTAQSGVYAQKIITQWKLQRKGSIPDVFEIGCPNLVPIVENQELYTEKAEATLSKYADRIKKLGADTLVLGCTHYPLLLPVLGPKLGDIKVVNPAELIPEYLSDSRNEEKGTLQIRVSGDAESFEKRALAILETPLTVEHTHIGGMDRLTLR